MIKSLKLLMLYLLSIFIWITWWITAAITIIILILFSFFIPKKYYNFWVKVICGILTKATLITPRLKGIPLQSIPFPVIFVANHVSFFDLFISGSTLPGFPRGLELKQHFSTPIYGWFITRFGQIPIDTRNTTSIKLSFSFAMSLLKNNARNILVMPEGSRTITGKIGPFKTGAFYLSRKSGIPIVPVVFKGLYRHNNKKNLLIIPGSFDVVLLPAVKPDSFTSDEEMSRHIRELMINELEHI